jgi:CheY-like chemotaxis protein
MQGAGRRSSLFAPAATSGMLVGQLGQAAGEVTMAAKAAPQHIVVINDEPVLLGLMREVLEDEGFRVTIDAFSEAGIALALARIAEAQPDLVIIDVLIRGEMLGWQLVQVLRVQPATARLPIIVCTAANTIVQQLGPQLTKLGVRVVLKPFDIETLLGEIRQALAAGGDPAAPTPP